MRRAIALGAALVLAIALLAVAAPRAPVAYDAPVPAAERAANAAILAALASAGIERAWVDAQPARVLVVLEPPAALAAEDALRYALGAAAIGAPDATELVARTTGGLEWRVEGAALRAYQAGEISRPTLEDQVERAQAEDTPSR